MASSSTSRSTISTARAKSIYLSIFLDSARIAGLTTVIAVVVAYPAAYAMSLAPPEKQTRYLFLVMLPFWSNYLIRTYAWIVLLNREGIINKGLGAVGVIDEPLSILYNEFAVVTGLVYNYLPFVILAIYSSIQRLNPEIREASEDLGRAGLEDLPARHSAADPAGRGRRRRSSSSCCRSAISSPPTCLAADGCRWSAT